MSPALEGFFPILDSLLMMQQRKILKYATCDTNSNNRNKSGKSLGELTG